MEDPFGELPHDVREHLPQKKTGSQHLLILAGLLIMVLGGLMIPAWFVLVIIADLSADALKEVVAIAVACCTVGYTVYLRGQRRRRMERATTLRQTDEPPKRPAL